MSAADTEGEPGWLIDPASVRPSIKRGPSAPVRNTLFRGGKLVNQLPLPRSLMILAFPIYLPLRALFHLTPAAGRKKKKKDDLEESGDRRSLARRHSVSDVRNPFSALLSLFRILAAVGHLCLQRGHSGALNLPPVGLQVDQLAAVQTASSGER